MPTLVHITYYERTTGADGAVTDTAVGTEAYDDIEEALVPTKAAHPVYITKRFSHCADTRWHVDESDRTGAQGAVPMTYRIVLSKVHGPQEIYLDRSLKLSSHKIQQVLIPGTLVEVDYGFVQTVAEAKGLMPLNHQYKDMIQQGEMHKRRLAVVVKVRPTQVQVVPLTSVAPDALDKTVFQISAATLSKLHFYGSNGKTTWGICNMIQTVSPSRILPPSRFYDDNGVRKHARRSNYPDRITQTEADAMQSALLHAIGVKNYDQLKLDAQAGRAATKAMAALETQFALVEQENAALKTAAFRLACIEELARDWAKQCGIDFEEQVQGLMEINTDLKKQD